MNIKKAIKTAAALGILIFTILLCGCSNDYAVEISTAQVSKGVFACYLDTVLSSPEQYGLKDGFTKKEAINKAVELCENHIAISSICEQRGFALSAIAKSDVATEVENHMGFFGQYYSSIGVSKQDYYLIAENSAKRALIIESLYGSGSKNPISNAELTKAFNKTHVGFKAITGYLTKINDDGSQEKYTSAEVKVIYNDFTEMAQKINDGTDIDKLNAEYNKSQGLSGPDKLTTILLDESDTTYSDGFYKKVKAIKVGEAAVIKTDGYIYVIQRMSISSNAYISQYKNDILEYLKSGDIDKMTDEWRAEYKKVKRSGLSEIYKTVVSQKNNVPS